MARRHIRVVGAMLQNAEGRYLITQRPPKATLPLLNFLESDNMDLVRFAAEFSVILARGRDGAVRFWDSPQNVHEGGIREWRVVLYRRSAAGH